MVERRGICSPSHRGHLASLMVATVGLEPDSERLMRPSCIPVLVAVEAVAGVEPDLQLMRLASYHYSTPHGAGTRNRTEETDLASR